MFHLPDKVVRGITNNDSQYVNTLKSLIPYSGIEGETYLAIQQGEMDRTDVHNGLFTDDEQEIHQWYTERINVELSINMLLLNGVLPPKNELDILLKHRTSQSQTFRVSPFNYSVPAMQELMTEIYSSIHSKEQVEESWNVSSTHLTNKVILALHNLYHHLVEQGEIKKSRFILTAPSEESSSPIIPKSSKYGPS